MTDALCLVLLEDSRHLLGGADGDDVLQLGQLRPHLERFVRTAPRAFYGSDIDRLRALLEGR